MGLAAPQVGVNLRLMVFNETGEPERKDKEMVLVRALVCVCACVCGWVAGWLGGGGGTY